MKAMTINEMMASGVYNDNAYRNVNMMRSNGVLSKFLPYSYNVLPVTKNLEERPMMRPITNDLESIVIGDKIFGKIFLNDNENYKPVKEYLGGVVKSINRNNGRIISIVIMTEAGEKTIDPSTAMKPAIRVSSHIGDPVSCVYSSQI